MQFDSFEQFLSFEKAALRKMTFLKCQFGIFEIIKTLTFNILGTPLLYLYWISME